MDDELESREEFTLPDSQPTINCNEPVPIKSKVDIDIPFVFD